MHLLISVLVLLQAGEPKKPAAPLDAKNPASVLEHAVYATRSLKSYEATFQSRTKPSGSDPLMKQGTATWSAPGLLCVHYTGSGGDDKKIIRAGNQAWVWYGLTGEWLTAEENGLSAAGTGLQNPDELLAALAANAGASRFEDPRTITLALPGPVLQRLLKDQVQLQGADWATSSADVRVGLNEQGSIRHLAVSARVVDHAFEGTLALGALGHAAPLRFLDGQRNPIPLSAKVREAMDKMLEEKR